MSKSFRDTRQKRKDCGVEIGDRHAPNAEDFRSAYQEAIDAQRELDRVMAGDVSPGLEVARRGIAGASEAIVERWHGVADDARYSLVRNLREFTQDIKQSTEQLAAAMLKAANEQGDKAED